MSAAEPGPLPAAEFASWLEREGRARYHDRHPFHKAMHTGQLDRSQIRAWVTNRYYYQTRIPIKDALILAKSEDPAFRRMWIRRLRDQDGDASAEGGLAQWLRLGEAVGIDSAELASCRGVLADVRRVCDQYVELVRGAGLLEAIAASLTETFAPMLMKQRVAAWEIHYPWIDPGGLDYFRSRTPKAQRDGSEALDFVLSRATSRAEQHTCVQALIRKTEILWGLLDVLERERLSGPEVTAVC